MAEGVSSGLMNVPAILPYLPQGQQAAIAHGKEEYSRAALTFKVFA